MDTKKSDGGSRFSVSLLFSEPLHFELGEIIEAVNEDFPSCAVKDPGINPKTSLRTDETIIAVLEPVEAHDGGVIKLIGLGVPDEAFRKADHTEAFWCTGGFGQAELAAHKSYLSVSVDAKDGSMASCFRAARILNAVTAVFAKLPITLAIHVEWGRHFVRPAHWVKAAEDAVEGNWPVSTWIAYRVAWDAGPGRSSDFAVGYTIGLSRFLDYELQMEAAPLKPTDVAQMLMATVWMPLQGGSVFEDGNTVGVEGDIRYRLRHRRGLDGEPNGILVLIHPDSPIDEDADFGPSGKVPTPMEEPYIRRPKKGFMQGLLGRH